MLSDKSRLIYSEWWNSGKLQLAGFLQSLLRQTEKRDLIGLVINPQYLKLLKLKQVHDQYEVEAFNIIDLPEGLMKDFEVKDSEAIIFHLQELISHSGIEAADVVFSIPRSSAIVKTIMVDNRLHYDEIESRVWLEANRLFPNLVGDICLDFAINGPSTQDPAQLEILIVACRKEQLRPYLHIIHSAGLTTKVVDVNYYAYERALLLITKRSPDVKTVAYLNINFTLMDLLGVHEGQLVYTHELSYDGHNLLKLRDQNANATATATDAAIHQVLKNTIGLHLKHALQFFYSSRPNVRLDRIILGGDVPATIKSVLDYVRQETGKEVVLANPFEDMILAANVDKTKLALSAPALMQCCGLALRVIPHKVVN